VTDARPPIPAGIREGGVVAVARSLTADTVRGVADGLLQGGVRALEITLNDPEDRALETLRAAARHAEGTNLDIGAGTVLTIEAAERAIAAGTTFLVSPHTDPGLVEWAAERGIPCFPGALTPTEILAAWRAGAAAVKLFPASVAGPAFVREFRGPFPQIPLLPTGGVTPDTAPDFIRAGAIAVGLGSWLMGDGDPRGIADRAETVVRAVERARRTPSET
jgi:2-dehydro-3-deoxyphosphogluconate aldolase/(4S)-4-hydroxy-2-oxoglutarate aldolase